MAMDETKAASKASDDKLRTALQTGNTASVQLAPQINRMRDQVARAGFGKAGRPQD